MRSAFVTFALAAIAAADPFPGAVSGSIAPKSAPPAGCSPNYSGDFEIQDTLISSSKRSLKARDNSLYITLTNGVLKDSMGRTGYIAANQQFQFDKPPQAGAIYTAGFAVCSNGSLALGDEAIWYSCLSGSFSNLYYESQGGQCKEVTLQVVPTSGSATTPAPPPPGSPTTPAPTSECTEYVDGQPQCTAVTAAPACTEYVDGQPQCSAVTAAPSPACTEYVDGQPQCSAVTAAPACTEYVDGQPQCSAVTAAPVCSEYSDGQPQCSTATPAPVCSEYSDGQPQCSTASEVCSEYSDGQPQCATATAAAVCSEYVDGQPQCASATPTAACSEYKDGQPQCSGTLAVATSSYTGAPIATGAANGLGMQKEMFGLAAAGVFAVAML